MRKTEKFFNISGYEETVWVILFALAALQLFFSLSLSADIQASENVTFTVKPSSQDSSSSYDSSLSNESKDVPLAPKSSAARQD